MQRRKKVKKPKKVGLNVRVVSQKLKKVAEKPEEKKISQYVSTKSEDDKKKIMIICVSFIMIFIIIIWFFNIKSVFKKIESRNEALPHSDITEDWNNMSDEFSKTLEKVRNELDGLKDESAQDIEEGKEFNPDIIINIEDLKIKLEEIKISTSTATSTQE